MNQTIRQLYQEYRDEMYGMIAVYSQFPNEFKEMRTAEKFQLQFDRLNALANLYAGLLLATGRRSRN